MIERDLAPQLLQAARQFPAVTLTGPRQSGKSTLCRELFPDLAYANLEAPDVRSLALDDPRAFLAQFPDGVIVDEIQRAPDIPSYLQGMIDADPRPGRFILTGSQNLALLRTVSQSLAGRTAVLQLLPLSRGESLRFEPHPKTLEDALFTGGYPAIPDRGVSPSAWLAAYAATYVERDARAVANISDLAAFQRFIELCAGRTGQLLNYSSLAADCGVSQPTAKAWFGVLEAGFIAFRLRPLHANLRKRLVKTPKLHFYDVGLACWLLGIRSPEQLRTHPLRGPLFETWVVTEIAKHRLNRGEIGGLCFYRDQGGKEADLIIERGDRLTVVEAKSSQTPTSRLLDSPRQVGLTIEQTGRPCEKIVVYGGNQLQQRSDGRIVPWSRLHQEDWT